MNIYKDMYTKLEKLFMRVATHKMEMGEDTLTEWILFINIFLYQH